MSGTCLFCNIIKGKEPATIVHQDDSYIAFKDKYPKSKNHFLVIPREHIKNAKSLNASTICIVEEMVTVAHRLINDNGGEISNSRIGFHWPPFNTINHLHLHVIFPEHELSFLANTMYRPMSFFFATPEVTIAWLEKRGEN